MKPIARIATLAVLALVASSVLGQGGTPLPCDESLYYTRSPGFGQPNQLARLTFDPLSNVDIGPPADPAYNAMGYNPTDGFLYAVIQGIFTPFPPEVVRISADGTYVNLGALEDYPTGRTTSNFGSATFLADGTLIINEISAPPGETDQLVLQVDVSQQPPRVLSSAALFWGPAAGDSPAISIIDIAFNPADGLVYGAEGGGGLPSDDDLVVIDLTTGEINLAPVQPATSDFWVGGAMFIDADNQAYAYGLDIDFLRIDLSTGEVTSSGFGPPAEQSDGGSCPFSIVFTKDVAPSATTLPATVVYTYRVVNPLSADLGGITFLDVFPDARSFQPGTVTITPEPAPGTATIDVAGDTLRITDLVLPATTILTIEVQADVPASMTAPDVVFNQARLTGLPVNQGSTRLSNWPASGTPDPTPTPLTLLAGPDLAVIKDDGGVVAVLDGEVTYAIEVTNLGDVPVEMATLSEVVPFGTTFVAGSSSPGWSCNNGAPAATLCNLVLTGLRPGETHARDFTVALSRPLPAGLEVVRNTVRVSAPDDTNPDNDTDTDTTPVDPGIRPDLAVSKDDGGKTTMPGGSVVWMIEACNLGAQSASGVVLTETVPTSTTFLAAGSPGFTCAGSGDAGDTCTRPIGALPAGACQGAAFAVSVSDQAPGGVDLINIVTVTDDGAGGPDANPANNTATDTTPVGLPPTLDLLTVKDDYSVNTTPGGLVRYILSACNIGSADASGVALRDTVPAHTTFVADLSYPGIQCADGAPAGTECVLPIGVLEAGTCIDYGFTVRTDADLTIDVPELSNTVTIDDDGTNGPDVDLSNNTWTDTTPVAFGVDLVVEKNDFGIDAMPGDVIPYQVIGCNSGPLLTTGTTLHETVPEGTSFAASASTAGWACSGDEAGSTCTLDLGTLDPTAPPGNCIWTTFAVEVLDTQGSVENTVRIDDDGTHGLDLDLTNNEAFESTPINPPLVDLAITKTVAHDEVMPGDIAHYTLTYRALSGDATMVAIAETIPEQTEVVLDQSSPGWVCTAQCIFELGELAAGDFGEVQMALRIKPSTEPGTLVLNIADLLLAEDDANPLDNTDTAEVVIVEGLQPVDVPTLGEVGLVALILALTALALTRMRNTPLI